MTKEDAIKILNTVLCFGKCDCTKDEIDECLKMAIKALETQPSEDCISRKAVFDALHSKFADGFNGDKWWNSTHVLNAINKVPSATPQPKTEGTRGDIPLQQSVPKMPQPSKHTEERTETHECDCISRKDIGLTNLEILMCNGDYKEALKMLLDKIEKAPSATPQQKTGHWIEHQGTFRPHIECSECSCWFLREDLPRNSYCPNCGSRNHWEWELKMQEVQK